MKFNKKILILALSSLILSACNPQFVEKTSEVLSEDVYGVGDSLAKGRVDLAEKYIQNVQTLVPAPKKRITIKPFISNGVQYVVIGDSFKNKQVVIVGSDQFQNLLKDKSLAEQYKKDGQTYEQKSQDTQKQLANNQLVTNNILLANQDLNKEVLEYHNSIEYKIKHFFNIFKWAFPLTIGALVIAGFFCPAVWSFLGIAAGLVFKIFNLFLEIIGNLIGAVSKSV